MTNAEMREKCLSPFLEQEALYKERIYPNIEKYRKGDFRLRLTDRDGKPLAGVTVEVRQETHDFKYGANIFMLDEFPTDAENAAYRDLFHRYFNLATVPFYWDGIEPQEGHPRYAADSEKVARRPAPDLCMDYCREHGIAPKLHCLFYDKWIPSWLPKTDADAMRRLYEKRFGEIAARYKDALYEVEVVNEMLEEQYWKTQSVLCAERDIVEWAFALARKHFPQSKLVFNEGCRVPFIAAADYRDPYILMLDRAIARGASVDKIGIQNHIFCGATSCSDRGAAHRHDLLCGKGRIRQLRGGRRAADRPQPRGLFPLAAGRVGACAGKTELMYGDRMKKVRSGASGGVFYLGLALIGVLAIPAAVLLGLIAGVWTLTDKLTALLEKKH